MAQGQGGRPRTVMTEVHKIIDQLIDEGVLSNKQIAEKAGCSMRTVYLKRRALFEVPSQNPVYRGEDQ